MESAMTTVEIGLEVCINSNLLLCNRYSTNVPDPFYEKCGLVQKVANTYAANRTQ